MQEKADHTSAGLTAEDLKIQRIPVPDPEYESEIPKHWKQNMFPGFPSTTLICGPPGRGKTNLLMNLLRNPKMWNKFFDKIYAYGPTVKSDKLYQTIKIKEENICVDIKEIIPSLEKNLEEQTKLVETSPAQAPKILWIFEDMTSFFNTVQQKPAFHRCYTQCRHVKGASVTMVHKYHAFHRTPRTSSQHIILFEVNSKDVKHLYEEFGPKSVSLRDFDEMVSYAVKPTEENPKPFLYVNTKAPEKIRYRKCFGEIMVLQDDLPMRMRERRSRTTKKRARSRSPEKDDVFGSSERDRF